MWLRKFSPEMCGRTLASVLVVGIVSYALWPQPTFRFLRGHRTVRADEHASAYELLGDSVELSRQIDLELTGKGFKRISEERWSKGRTTEYESPDENTQIFLVWDADRAGSVSFWIRPLQGPSQLTTLLSDLSGLVCRPPCYGAFKNACIANLRLLENGKANWAIENSRGTNAIPSDADLFGPQAYIRVKPECPEGGRYTLGPVGEPPHCSIPWHHW